MRKRAKTRPDPEVRNMVKEIMRGRKEERIRRKEQICTGDWEDIIPLISEEEEPDVSFYRSALERAGISLDEFREMAGHSRARMRRMNRSDSIEITFRKADHSAAIVIADGKIKSAMRDRLTY